MTLRLTLLCLLFSLWGCSSSGTKSEVPKNSPEQKSNSPESKRATNTDKLETEENPSKENDTREIHFTELWTWEYLDENGEWDEIWIYREPNLDYWLFDKSSSYGMTNEMCEWVVGTPDGQYWFNCQDAEFGAKPTLHKMEITFHSPSSLSNMWENTQQKKEFGDPAQGFGTFVGESYDVHYLGQKEASKLYITQSNVDMRPVYYFNQLDGDGRLPIMFPVDVPKNTIILSEKTDIESSNIRIRYRFKDISPNSYYVELPE